MKRRNFIKTTAAGLGTAGLLGSAGTAAASDLTFEDYYSYGSSFERDVVTFRFMKPSWASYQIDGVKNAMESAFQPLIGDEMDGFSMYFYSYGHSAPSTVSDADDILSGHAIEGNGDAFIWFAPDLADGEISPANSYVTDKVHPVMDGPLNGKNGWSYADHIHLLVGTEPQDDDPYSIYARAAMASITRTSDDSTYGWSTSLSPPGSAYVGDFGSPTGAQWQLADGEEFSYNEFDVTVEARWDHASLDITDGTCGPDSLDGSQVTTRRNELSQCTRTTIKETFDWFDTYRV